MLRRNKGSAAALLVVALLVVGSAGSAWAVPYWTENSFNWVQTTAPGKFFPQATRPNWEAVPNSFSLYGNKEVPYFITPIAYNSFLPLRIVDTQPPPDWIRFTNQNTASEFGQSKMVDMLKNAGVMTENYSIYKLYYGGADIYRMRLIESWTLANSLTLPAGALIVGIGRNAGVTGDQTYDDYIFALSTAAPTPIPGAVWLLGSGLVGLMGFKRARKHA